MAHSIGKTIAELRKAKGLTQVELAEKLGVSDKAVSKWESEGGFPEITQFPVLASIFDVSIDYLFTGKERNSIVLMSTMEHCAKSDAPSFLDKFRFDAVDEHGHDVIHYVKKYQSLKVMAEIIRRRGFAPLVDYRWKDRYYFDSFVINEKTFKDCLYYAVLTNTVDCLMNAYKAEADFYKALASIEYTELETAEYSKIFQLLLDCSIASDETRDLLLSFDKDSIWKKGILEFFHTAVVNKNWKAVDKYFSMIEEYNLPKIKKLSELNEKYTDKTEVYDVYRLTEYGKEKRAIEPRLPVLKKTILALIDMSDLKRAEKYYNFNCKLEIIHFDFAYNDWTVNHVVELGDILRVAKEKASGESDREIRIQSAIHAGILIVDELFETGDYQAIEEAIKKYPIHEIEKTRDLSSLWTVIHHPDYPNDLYGSKKTVIGANAKYIQQFLESTINKNITPREEIKYPQTKEEAEQIIAKTKEMILEHAKLKYDKEDILKELNREYFLNQLEVGNEEMVIIKLCKRLESILKGTYLYKGDFLSMLNRYIYEHEQCWDNLREEYFDAEICSYLHKLRITRNNMVHAETATEPMTKEDILRCIDYICEMK